MPITIQAVPALSDNYIWLLHETETGAIVVVDPGEADPVLHALHQAGGRLDAIWLTHHHSDHIAGVAAVRAAYPTAPVIGASADQHRLPTLDRAVVEGDVVALGNASARVIDTPGHTLGHISYFVQPGNILLCGDTLFSLGCGKLLEGTAAHMFDSLRKLAALPDDTLVCCGHEYTHSNASFALSIDAENAALQDRARQVTDQRHAGQPTVPSRLGDERAANPFLRAPDVATLGQRRRQKDLFRG